MDLNLAGKTALVTGGSKGIGLAVARQLAEEGCSLHLASRTREVYPAMIARGSGVIVNVLGTAGERPTPSYIAGSMGNASLMALCVALGGESVDKGVRVVGVNPGLIETERMVTLSEARAEQKFGDKTRWREFLENMPQGTIVTVDGGVTKRATL